MQPLLTSLSPDLSKLLDEGYDIEVRGGHLLVHHIPYVTRTLEIKYGTLVCVLTLAGPNRTAKPKNHTAFFIGETPCDSTGSALNSIINNSNTKRLTEDIVVNHYFSSKPASGNYDNFYDKVRTYSEILSSQAKVIDSSVTCRPNKQKPAA